MKPTLAAFVLTLNSAVIWNVPAVHCTQKTAAVPKPDPGICTEGRRTGEAQAPGPRGLTWIPWEETDGQEWRGVKQQAGTHTGLCLSPEKEEEKKKRKVYDSACVCVCLYGLRM